MPQRTPRGLCVAAMHEQRAPAAAACPASLSRLCSFKRARGLPHSPLASPLSFPLALLLRAATSAMAVAAEAPWPAVLGPPQAELWAPSCAYALAGAPRRCQPPPANAGQLLRRRRRSCAPARRARAWPGQRGPPPASSSAHTGAGGYSGAHAILPRRRQASSGRHREPPTASSALIHVKDFAQEFEEREGPICNVIDSCE